MSTKLISTKEMFLQYVDPENHPPEPPQLTEEEVEENKRKQQSINRLIEMSNQEFYKKASANVKYAIDLRKEKDKKTGFYRQLQELNDKITIFKTLQQKQEEEDQKQPPSPKKKHTLSR